MEGTCHAHGPVPLEIPNRMWTCVPSSIFGTPPFFLPSGERWPSLGPGAGEIGGQPTCALSVVAAASHLGLRTRKAKTHGSAKLELLLKATALAALASQPQTGLTDWRNEMNKYSKIAAVAASAFVAMNANAEELNLTDASSPGGFINGAFFERSDYQPAGTGVIDPFLRLQETGTEEGFNTTEKNVLNNKDGTWTHALQVIDVPVTVLNDVSYYKILLDINQTNTDAGKFLTLNSLRIYQETTGGIGSYSLLTNLRYDMDGLGDTSIELNYELNPGSGGGDMFAYIPIFANTGGYFYLYSKFGDPNRSNDGFEEWATVGTTAPIPEPETYALMLAGLGVMGFMARRRKAN